MWFGTDYECSDQLTYLIHAQSRVSVYIAVLAGMLGRVPRCNDIGIKDSCSKLLLALSCHPFRRRAVVVAVGIVARKRPTPPTIASHIRIIDVPPALTFPRTCRLIWPTDPYFRAINEIAFVHTYIAYSGDWRPPCEQISQDREGVAWPRINAADKVEETKKLVTDQIPSRRAWRLSKLH